MTAVEAIQKAYLGVGKVLTSDEARRLVNQYGADLDIPGPDFTPEPDPKGGANGQPTKDE